MNSIIKHTNVLIRFVKIIVSLAAVLGATKLTQEFGSLANVSTTAFIFLIIVLLAAFFGDFLVAFITSITATLCFDYYFLPPYGTFSIASFTDWIALAAFLLTSVIISRLTASATENNMRAIALNKSLKQLQEFGKKLLSIPDGGLTLSGIAKTTLDSFSLEYCSIHVYGDGRWWHYTGSASSESSQEIDNSLKIFQDHPTAVMDLAEENLLGVRYARINDDKQLLALLAVKSKTLPTEALGAIAYTIGVRLIVTNLKGNHHENVL